MARGQNIISRVFNKPQFITVDAFQPLVDYLSDPKRLTQIKLTKPDDKVEQLARYQDESNDSYRFRRLGINPDTMTGYLQIKDVLVNREGQINADCVELTSYEGLKKTFKAQVAEGITSCVLMVDSGGGEAYGCFEAANAVKKLAQENNVKLTAYVDGTSASAAYAWTSIADEIIANPMARVGSVGVVVQLYNDSKFLENLGIQRSFVYAGGNKIPFDKNGDFSENFINSLQESVDKSYVKFYQFIATNRDMTDQQVIDTQASVYDADKALEVGFIDKIMEVDEFESYMSMNNNDSSQNLLLQHEDKMTDKVELTVEGLQEQLSTLTASNTDLTAKLSAEVAKTQELQTKLQDMVVAKEKAEADLVTFQKNTELAARKERLAAVFGSESEKVELYATMFKDLPQESFNTFVGEFEANLEEQDKKMGEKGHSAPVEPITKANSLEAAAKARAEKRQK